MISWCWQHSLGRLICCFRTSALRGADTFGFGDFFHLDAIAVEHEGKGIAPAWLDRASSRGQRERRSKKRKRSAKLKQLKFWLNWAAAARPREDGTNAATWLRSKDGVALPSRPRSWTRVREDFAHEQGGHTSEDTPSTKEPTFANIARDIAFPRVGGAPIVPKRLAAPFHLSGTSSMASSALATGGTHVVVAGCIGMGQQQRNNTVFYSFKHVLAQLLLLTNEFRLNVAAYPRQASTSLRRKTSCIAWASPGP